MSGYLDTGYILDISGYIDNMFFQRVRAQTEGRRYADPSPESKRDRVTAVYSRCKTKVTIMYRQHQTPKSTVQRPMRNGLYRTSHMCTSLRPSAIIAAKERPLAAGGGRGSNRGDLRGSSGHTAEGTTECACGMSSHDSKPTRSALPDDDTLKR